MNKRSSGLSTVIKDFNNEKEQSEIELNKIKKKYVVKIANTREERKDSFKLAYNEYSTKEYVSNSRSQQLINTYDFNKETVVFVVNDSNNKVVATASLVFNKSIMLPAEKTFKNEINTIKKKGKDVVEVSRLAIKHSARNSKEVLVLLFNHMFIYGYRVKKYQTAIIQVNPKHKNYYKKILNFSDCGVEKQCSLVNGAPANLLYFTLSNYPSEIKKAKSKRINHFLYANFANHKQENKIAINLKKEYRPISVYEKIVFYLIIKMDLFCKQWAI